MTILRNIWNLILWNVAIVAFNYLPESIVLKLAAEHCSVACQLVAKRDNTGIVLLVEAIPATMDKISGHYMNIDSVSNEFYDYFGNRIPATDVGQLSTYGSWRNATFMTVAKVGKWSDFKYTSLFDMFKRTKKMNNHLWETFKQ